jgi:micrococcal nuclease
MKIHLAIPALLGVLLLAGCSSPDPVEPAKLIDRTPAVTQTATPTPTPTPTPPPPPAPKPTPKPAPKPAPKPPANDPQFRTCGDANDAGYGDYVKGVDPEYAWYQDRDGDGIVCER